ncbi:hypothetical protein RRG08_017663 [Elysia crispata]|uniref:Uncharacterized protein n=1 Tax=Elysia crispata TaxID=231223 RepID=A0AAE0ZBA3_9GAST|nr:hypothetical protein RRG08_017663 [Elysia crispata]
MTSPVQLYRDRGILSGRRSQTDAGLTLHPKRVIFFFRPWSIDQASATSDTFRAAVCSPPTVVTGDSVRGCGAHPDCLRLLLPVSGVHCSNNNTVLVARIYKQTSVTSDGCRWQ